MAALSSLDSCQPTPKLAEKKLQYRLEKLGGHAFTCFDLTSQATRKGGSKPNLAFEEEDDEEIDQGFDHILRKAPRSTCEMAQLKWQTKELRNKDSPIFGWPCGLVSQALKSVSSDGACAQRSQLDWPLPLMSLFYDTSVLKLLEKIWDFDQSALTLLGGWRRQKPPRPIGAYGPSQIQSGWTTLHSMHACAWLSERKARLCIDEGFLRRHVSQHPGHETCQGFPRCWPLLRVYGLGSMGGPANGCKTNLGLLQTTSMKTGWTCRMTSSTISPLRISTS